MIELAIAFAVATYFTRNGVTDIVAALKGQKTPRQVAALSRARARVAAAEAHSERTGTRPGRSGSPFLAYVREAWDDAWVDARAKHQTHRAERAERATRTRSPFRAYVHGVTSDARTRYWDQRWERADEKRKARTRPYDPDPVGVIVPGVVVPDPVCGCCGMRHGRPMEPGEHCDWCTAHDTQTAEPVGMYVLSFGDEPDHHAWSVSSNSLDELLRAARKYRAASGAKVGIYTGSDPETGADLVTPFGTFDDWGNFVKTPTTETPAGDVEPENPTDGRTPPTMTDTQNAGEIISLNTALAYCGGLATALEQTSAGFEAAAAGLTAGGVTGSAVGHLASAQEHVAAAAAAMRAAEQELIHHLAVQEAYAANQGAGTREFVQAD